MLARVISAQDPTVLSTILIDQVCMFRRLGIGRSSRYALQTFTPKLSAFRCSSLNVPGRNLSAFREDWLGDCNRRCMTERAAERRRDLTGLRRTYGISGETGPKGCNGSRAAAIQMGRVLRGDPSGGSNTPVSAVDSQNH